MKDEGRTTASAPLRALLVYACCLVLSACGAFPQAPRGPQGVGPTAAAPAPAATPQVLADEGGEAPTELVVALEPTVTLKLGETIALGVGGASISFDEVLEDSRCPANAQCLWQGRIVIAGTLTLDGQALPFTIGSLKGFDDAPASFQAGPFTISIVEVTPYPQTPDGIPSEEYTLTLALE